MKREIETIKRCSLFLLNHMLDSNVFKAMSKKPEYESFVKAIKESSNEFPITSIRNYSTIRNKLIRLLKGFHSCHQLQLLSKITNDYELSEVNQLFKGVWDIVDTPPHDPFFDLEKMSREFKLITIGKI